MIKVLVHGSNGKMGGHLITALKNNAYNCVLAAGVDRLSDGKEDYPFYTKLTDVKESADCLIDFSFHGAIKCVLDYAISKNIAIIIATTGFTEEENEIIKEASKIIPVFLSANMSVGIALLIEFAKKSAKIFPDADIEIVEAHHNRKIDAPSGTAMMIASAIKEERANANFVYGRSGECKRKPNDIGIHALRMANIVGEHEVLITTENQQLILKHTAFDRALLAEGAVNAAAFITGKPAGLYNMQDMLKNRL